MKLIVAHALGWGILLALCACGGGETGAPPAPTTQVGRTDSLTLASQNTGASYPITVYLPSQYDANATALLPVIYALDGDAAFGYPSGVTRFEALRQVLQQRGTAAILVGVGGTARRNADFLPPGSVAYERFLAQELVPRIDATYRTAPVRVLSGLSYGGTMVFLAFTYEGAHAPVFTQF